jgi:tetratricopeptide (TPR) repeat protein
MSMNPELSPLTSLVQYRPGPARGAALAKTVALVCIQALALGVMLAGLVRAQKPLADITSMNRAFTKNAPAYQALQEGRVDDAANLLRATLAADPADAAAHQLLCRVFYSQDAANEAIHECELAVAFRATDDGQASDNLLWVGRAYGMKARHAGPISGFKLARKVQSSFASAVELNPANVPALNDLGEYDVAAPFVVGGGLDKAHTLADRMMPNFPGPAHHLLARIAQADNDLAGAESEFKQEIAAQRSTESASEAWIDLAQFYQTHERPDDAVSAIKSGLAVDRTHGPVLIDAASILTAAHRAPDLAERCLRDYLSSNAKSDAAPAFKVHLQLSRLLAARGDTRDANRETAAAAALAPAFARSARPAQGL